MRERVLAERWAGYVRVGDGCWEWAGARDGKGYGRLHVSGRLVPAHRVGYELLVGPISPGLFACHHCDNPPCVRPDHIFPGTQQENVDDMRAKGRCCYSKRLTLAVAQEIRAVAREQSPSLAAMAARFGVSKSTVSEILLGKTWPDGTAPIHIDGSGSRHPRSKFSPDTLAEIRHLRAGGVSIRQLAARFGVHVVTARLAATGRSYRRT